MAEEIRGFKFPGTLRRWTLTREVALKAGIVLGLIILLALLFPRGETLELENKVGVIWAHSDLLAPFSFPLMRDDREYETELAQAKAKAYSVFERDSKIADLQLGELDAFFSHLKEALKTRARYRSTQSRVDSVAFAGLSSQLGIRFFEREWDVLSRLSPEALKDMHQTLRRLSDKYLQTGVLDVEKKSLGRSEIALRKGTIEEIIPLSGFHDHNEVVSLLETDLVAFYQRDNDTVDVAHKIGVMHQTPNIKLNQAETELAMKAAVESVPRTSGFVEEGERIVGKNERVTPGIKQKLDSLQKARVERGGASSGPIQFLGILLHVAIVLTLFGIYLHLFRKKIFWSNRKLALIALLILLVGFFAYLSRVINVSSPVEYLIFVPAASMLLTIIFDSRVGFYGTAIMAFLAAGIRGNDYDVAIASLVAGALSVYTVRDVRNRSQIIRSVGFIFLGYALTILALGMERIEPWGTMLEALTFGLANSIISPVLTFGLLIFFEQFFRVTTDLTLIELGHFNHPLLKMLAEKAPGTYHHSMTMASLAETAASAVGANEVLARVGAYFHDIGKIEKPTYFVENQRGSRNRHDKLAPRMSSLIIQNHVKKGMLLAREYNLPEEIVDFIPQHHGTTRVDYFYRKALMLAESSDDESKIDEINDQDYRYPGPKPQTKETGILMLADSIEAAARTLDDPSPQKLEVLIDDLFKKRFEEGELDECPLTLKDLTKIKKAFLGVLVGVYHGRVKYPEDEEEREQKRGREKQEESDSKQESDDETQPTDVEPLIIKTDESQ
ncbi:MAG: HDIG domain-containing metalloprotein [bacterium]